MKDGFSVKAEQSIVDNFLTVVELRNAMAHGGVSLTSRQMADPEKFARLSTQLAKALAVTVLGKTLRAGPNSGTQTVDHVRRFVCKLDEAVVSKYGYLDYSRYKDFTDPFRDSDRLRIEWAF